MRGQRSVGRASVERERGARWRVGMHRFPRSPYANLLISRHAHWLSAIRGLPDPDPAFAHPRFWKGSPEQLYPGTNEAPPRLLAELEEMAARPLPLAAIAPLMGAAPHRSALHGARASRGLSVGAALPTAR